MPCAWERRSAETGTASWSPGVRLTCQPGARDTGRLRVACKLFPRVATEHSLEIQGLRQETEESLVTSNKAVTGGRQVCGEVSSRQAAGPQRWLNADNTALTL